MSLSSREPLARLGFDSFFDQHFTSHTAVGLVPGRVVAEHRGATLVATAHGEHAAELAGRLWHTTDARADLPAVGDWVALRLHEGARAVIHAVLPRRSAFLRGVAGGVTEAQVVAANVDVVLVVLAATDLSARRVERYLALAHASRVEPVVVVTKCDVDVGAEERARAAMGAVDGVPLHTVSGRTGDRVHELAGYFAGNRTIALLGSSGAGKSTLANRLLGAELQRVSHVAADGRGRHTTTTRQLVARPGGGLVLDTPGMRELRLWDAGDARGGLEDAFADIAELAARCAFRDCRHDGEPGCAIAAALDDGRLDALRWSSYLKLDRELAALAVRQDARKHAERKRALKVIARARRARPPKG